MKITIQTHNGNFLTAVGGGGKGDPAGMAFNSVPFHTNATRAQGWEIFSFVPAGHNRLALVTQSGNYVTAVYGGGMTGLGGDPMQSVALHTNAHSAHANEIFEIVPIGSGKNTFALRTTPGNQYVTAINGGGMGDPAGQEFNSWPLHTNATRIQDWEKFKITPINTPLNDAKGHAQDAKDLSGMFADFERDYGDHLKAIKAASKSKTMTADTSQKIKEITRDSDFMKTAQSRFSDSKTIAFAFVGEASAFIGGSIAVGVAFDTGHKKFLFFETIAGSLGFDVGANASLRLGFFDYGLVDFTGWSTSLQVDLGAGLQVALAGVKNLPSGVGIELAFGTGIEDGVEVALGYTAGFKFGPLPGS